MYSSVLANCRQNNIACYMQSSQLQRFHHETRNFKSRLTDSRSRFCFKALPQHIFSYPYTKELGDEATSTHYWMTNFLQSSQAASNPINVHLFKKKFVNLKERNNFVANFCIAIFKILFMAAYYSYVHTVSVNYFYLTVWKVCTSLSRATLPLTCTFM